MSTGIKKSFFLLLVLYSGFFFIMLHQAIPKENQTSDLILQYNELQKKYESGSLQEQDFTILQDEILHLRTQKTTFSTTPWIILYIGSVTALMFIYLYLSQRILKPFASLQRFANEIARGNLDAPLKEQRGHVFGAFSWAFDNLRFELKKARESEAQTVENSKTVIASLSHDIKTPVSSIRACSEALTKGMDTTQERKERHLKTIIKKCDEVSTLTDDLFLHSLQDMDALQYHNEWVELDPYLYEVQETLQEEYRSRIQLPKDSYSPLEGKIYIDRKRFIQVIENLFQNAVKYTVGAILLTYRKEPAAFLIEIRDEGTGIADHDLPFIFEKFYRSKGVEQIPGAGLGLYLVKEMMQKMNGSVSLRNTHPGLCVTLAFQIK